MKQKEKKKKKITEKKRLIKDRIIRDIWTLFEQEEDYYEPKRVNNFWNNNYIEYESNGDKKRHLSLDKYFNKIEPYLRNIITDLQNSNTWKIQLTISINNFNYNSSKDVAEEHVMHSRSDNVKFTFYNDPD